MFGHFDQTNNCLVITFCLEVPIAGLFSLDSSVHQTAHCINFVHDLKSFSVFTLNQAIAVQKFHSRENVIIDNT